MYTSVKQRKRYILCHFIAAAFFALFGVVYEHFSHGVFSAFMVFAFTIPLAAGGILQSLLLIANVRIPDLALRLWNYAIALLTAGCIWKGVLDIYGTTNRLLLFYPIIGGILALLATALFIIKKKTSFKSY